MIGFIATYYWILLILISSISTIKRNTYILGPSLRNKKTVIYFDNNAAAAVISKSTAKAF